MPEHAPYEQSLLRAFDKLTSEIFLFLLAYMILLIGVGFFAPKMATIFRTLFFILPIVGIAAYVWLRSRSLAKDAEAHCAQIWSGVATGSAYVAGLRGRLAAAMGRAKVFSGVASGDARVIAIDTGDVGVEDGLSQETYLLSLFRKLEEPDRRKIVNEASMLVDAHADTSGNADA